MTYRTLIFARRAAQERECLSGKQTKPPPITVTDDQIEAANNCVDGAQDAGQAFLRRAVATIVERDPEIRQGLEQIREQADAKRRRPTR